MLLATETSNSVLITTLILASIAPTLTALAGVIIAIINTTRIGVVHELVNSAMTEQKRLSAMFARRVADSSKNPKDIELAEQAEKIYNDALKGAQFQQKV